MCGFISCQAPGRHGLLAIGGVTIILCFAIATAWGLPHDLPAWDDQGRWPAIPCPGKSDGNVLNWTVCHQTASMGPSALLITQPCSSHIPTCTLRIMSVSKPVTGFSDSDYIVVTTGTTRHCPVVPLLLGHVPITCEDQTWYGRNKHCISRKV